MDASVQAAIFNLLLDAARTKYDHALYAHDLSVVRFFSDNVAVMYLGQIMEIGPADAIYRPPYHPYTEALLSAVPIPDPTVKQKQIRLEACIPRRSWIQLSDVASTPVVPGALPARRRGHLHAETPPWQEAGDGHRIFCHLPLETLASFDPVVESLATH
ncbi:MAG: ABC transporter ATP-binding protein [Candidatus Promineofilum sp.]|uniref:ABC transporter ATP-binding protein n=1 Tax=Promineifilum sp. TaxID=2664178 RepID=UPI002411FC30|nr:ABC transporter ATP-binding protein [Promineifilum sp.]